MRQQAGTHFQFTSVIGYLNYHLVLALGSLILVRSQLLLIFIVLRLRVKIDVLDLAKVTLFLGLAVLVELIVEQAIAKRAFLEIAVVWVARFAVNILPELPQFLIWSVDVVLEMTAISGCLRQGGRRLERIECL